MRKFRALMIALAIMLTVPTLVLAVAPSAPSQARECYTYNHRQDCLFNFGCFFRATYTAWDWVCCENLVCESGTVRFFDHCGCN